jgi:hypothetical protein
LAPCIAGVPNAAGSCALPAAVWAAAAAATSPTASRGSSLSHSGQRSRLERPAASVDLPQPGRPCRGKVRRLLASVPHSGSPQRHSGAAQQMAPLQGPGTAALRHWPWCRSAPPALAAAVHQRGCPAASMSVCSMPNATEPCSCPCKEWRLRDVLQLQELCCANVCVFPRSLRYMPATPDTPPFKSDCQHVRTKSRVPL